MFKIKKPKDTSSPPPHEMCHEHDLEGQKESKEQKFELSCKCPKPKIQNEALPTMTT